jgi:WD40 repeat protein
LIGIVGLLVAQLGHSDVGVSIPFSPDGKHVLTRGGGESSFRLWDVENGIELLRFRGHTVAVTSATFSGDGTRALSASEDGTARMWDVYSGRELQRLSPSLAVTPHDGLASRLW